MKNNLICKLCGYQAKTPQGLAGHKQFKHQLAERFPKPNELARKAQALQSREIELARSVELLEQRKTQLIVELN
jgi:hypothetical protein